VQRERRERGGNGDASDTSDGATTAGFCEKLNALGPAVSTSGSSDAAAFTRLKAWIADMEDYGTPSELSADERKGAAILVALFEQVDEDTSQADFQNLGKDLSKDEQEKMDSFSAWANKNCSPTTSDPSPTSDPSGDAS
jgi:hypothetical protein